MRDVRHTRVIAPLAGLLCLAACVDPAPSGTQAAVDAPLLQADDVVEVTLYFRAGEGAEAHLSPVQRELSLADDLPRTALELLIAGPDENESGLHAPLPPSTDVLDLRVDGSTAAVNLSEDVIRDAAAVGAHPAHEVLALGAVTNTLTEFPSISRVEVRIEGLARGADGPIDAGAFWGDWGLPSVLVRDDSIVGPPAVEGEGVADIGNFSGDEQVVGVADASPTQVTSVRARSLLTHVRFVVELAAVDGEAEAMIPVARAVRDGDTVRLAVAGVAAAASTFEERIDEATVSPSFESVRVERDEASETLILVVETAGDRDFWLHAREAPARVVLDIRK